WDRDRLATAFRNDAASLAADTDRLLHEPMQALQALAGAYRAAGGMNSGARRRRSRLHRLHTRADERRRRPRHRPHRPARGERPRAGRRRDDGHGGASGRRPRTRLSQSDPHDDENGFVLYYPLYDGAKPHDPAGRQQRFAGVLFVTVRAERLLAALPGNDAAGLRWCLVDTEPGVERARLAGPAGCENERLERLSARHRIALASRTLELRVSSTAAWERERQQTNAWVFSVAGLAAAAVLGALLLTVTGRAHRIGLAVEERTAELRREIGERRRAEEEMREVQDRLRGILDNVPIGVMFADLDGRLVETNPCLCSMLGRSAEELVNCSLDDISHPDEREADRQALEELRSGRASTVRRQTRLQRADGAVLHARTLFTLLRDAAGQPWRLAGVAEDITEHRRLEESERALHRAEAANRAKTEFLSRTTSCARR
uniref:PAS domain S-box protein n=1 Tax=Rubrivivax gelatinosus TaxID=28068 RepID=UPI002872AD03